MADYDLISVPVTAVQFTRASYAAALAVPALDRTTEESLLQAVVHEARDFYLYIAHIPHRVRLGDYLVQYADESTKVIPAVEFEAKWEEVPVEPPM